MILLFLLCTGVLSYAEYVDIDPIFGESVDSSPQQKPTVTLSFGDMALTEKQRAALKNGTFSFNAVKGENLRWKGAVIPYVIDCSIENIPNAVPAVMAAMKQWERKTCIRFVKHTNEEFHLTFFRNTHCWGNVGQVSYSHISVGPGCEYEHVMAHEIGHVVGFYHEQNRMDRDDWVKIHWENIGQFKDAFDLVENTDPLGIPYDYESIMHYPWTAFSVNGGITMEPIQDTKGKVPYVEISKDDIKLTSLMYNCPAIERKRNRMMKRSRIQKRDITDEDCFDVDQYCPDRAKAGECSESEAVRDACRLSCGSPECGGSDCQDKNAACKDWASIGYCSTSAQVMHLCQKSCNPLCQDKIKPTEKPATGGPVPTVIPRGTGDYNTWPNRNFLGVGVLCKDYHKKCAEKAANGDCDKEPDKMLKVCKKSCPKAYCDRSIVRPPGDCTNPVGLSSDGSGNFKIPDSAFYATSVLKPGAGWAAGAANARLYFTDDRKNKRIGAWCAGDYKNPGFLQVDLQKMRTLTYIATQGRDRMFERTEKFKIQYSDDGRYFTTYQEDGKDHEFYGNCDHFTPVLNKFKNNLRTRFIRYIPLKSNWPCVRMEFYGCE